MSVGRERTNSGRGRRSVRAPGLFAGILAVPILLSGCSTVPDWADPSDWFEPDETPTRVGVAPEQADHLRSAGFPNLASVPDTPPTVTPAETRARLQENLAADRANARYSGERLVAEAPSEAPTTRAAPGPSEPTTRRLQGPIPPSQGDGPAASQPAASQPAASQPGAPAGTPPRPRIAGELLAPPEAAAPKAAPVEPAPVEPAPAGPAAPRAQVAQGATPAPAERTQLRLPEVPVTAAPPGAAAIGLVGVIYFAHGSARLDANDRSVLRDIVALQRERGGVIRVVGHASAHTEVMGQVKHRLTNFEISLERANAVAAQIVALGADKGQVRAEAKGDTQPVYHEFMPTGEAGNRRVEIFLEY